jgi:hypothetical protein
VIGVPVVIAHSEHEELANANIARDISLLFKSEASSTTPSFLASAISGSRVHGMVKLKSTTLETQK